jgi:hypothetical protein
VFQVPGVEVFGPGRQEVFLIELQSCLRSADLSVAPLSFIPQLPYSPLLTPTSICVNVYTLKRL